MTAANKITIARILLVPLFVALILLYVRGGEEKYRVAAIVCFAVALLVFALSTYLRGRLHL